MFLRPCLRVCHARQNIAVGEIPPPTSVGPFKKNWTRWAAIPKFRLVLHGELNKKLHTISDSEPEAKPTLVHSGDDSKTAIITSGSVSSHVRDIVLEENLASLDVYKVDMPFPLNVDALQSVIDSHDKTLVIEETQPVIEMQIGDRRTVKGRLSGDVPNEGEITPELVEQILFNALGKTLHERRPNEIKTRRPSLCAGCPHRPGFYLIKQVFPDAIYSGDIGCYTLGINMQAVDTCLCMGSSVGLAGGLNRSAVLDNSVPVVATIGDSTFYHSGIAPLINAVHNKAGFVLVIMDNHTTAMTGGQPTPAGEVLADGSEGKSIDMEGIVRGCGVGFVQTVDPYDYEGTRRALESAKEHTFTNNHGVSVVITRRPCVRSKGVPKFETKFIIGDGCDRCMICIRDLECPAISYSKESKKVVIDDDICFGCGFCTTVCPSQAIQSSGGK